MKSNDLIIDLSGSSGSTPEAKLREIGHSQKMSITYMKAERPPIVEYTP